MDKYSIGIFPEEIFKFYTQATLNIPISGILKACQNFICGFSNEINVVVYCISLIVINVAMTKSPN